MAIYALGDKCPTFKGKYYVAENAAVIGNVVFENNANVWFGVTIRGDNDTITLGENVNVQDGSVLHTDEGVPLTLHKNVSVGHLATLHGCTVEEGALIGIGAIVLNGAVIGARSLIGAGALVGEGKQIPPGVLALGAPAKVVRPLTTEQQEYLAFIARHYAERADTYRETLTRIE
jgi:carbonic anhydrase/acetyltransferase-like protein (isoleucine patch superfamily)